MVSSEPVVMWSRIQSACSLCALFALSCLWPGRTFAQCAGQGDCFVDTQGKPGSAAAAYRTLHLRDEPHYLRAALEETVFVGAGMTWYWLDRRNRADWDFPGAGERLSTDILRFDNNTFPINFLWHPWSGAAYHYAPRMNNLNLGASMAYGIGTSFLWEYVLEFREKVSINDLISTPVAGIALGEFFSRFAWYVGRPVSSHARGRVFGAYSFGLLRTLHDHIDHTKRSGPGPADNLGYSSWLWHRFVASAGVAANATDNLSLNGTFVLEGTFVAIPSYLRPGRFRKFVYDADVTRFRFNAVTSFDERGDYDLFSDTILAGYYLQDISDEGVGGSVLIGSGLGYRYRRVEFDGFVDDVSLTHMPGLSLEGDVLYRHAGVHLSARVSPDFAGLRAWAFDAWQRDHPDERTKTVLERAGYAYAFGGSGSLELELSVRGLRLGARGLVGRYASTEGLDRNQEDLTVDVATSDLVLDAESYARIFPIPGRAFMLELSGIMRKRVSSVESYQRHGSLFRAGLSLGVEI